MSQPSNHVGSQTFFQGSMQWCPVPFRWLFGSFIKALSMKFRATLTIDVSLSGVGTKSISGRLSLPPIWFGNVLFNERHHKWDNIIFTTESKDNHLCTSSNFLCCSLASKAFLSIKPANLWLSTGFSSLTNSLEREKEQDNGKISLLKLF